MSGCESIPVIVFPGTAQHRTHSREARGLGTHLQQSTMETHATKTPCAAILCLPASAYTNPYCPETLQSSHIPSIARHLILSFNLLPVTFAISTCFPLVLFHSPEWPRRLYKTNALTTTIHKLPICSISSMANLRATIKSWLPRLLSYFMCPLRFLRPRPPGPLRIHPPHKPPVEDSDSEEDDAEEFTTSRSRYRMGRTLGAGTYGIVREADCNEGKVAVKIILKKNVRGNEQMVYDELAMLQKLHHAHIVRFHDWFESRVSQDMSYYVVYQH